MSECGIRPATGLHGKRQSAKNCGAGDVSSYSAPARATDLSRLPQTFIDVGACEVFRDEAIDYAVRILASGGQCELHIWGGAVHGFYDIAPQSELARACIAARNSWLERLLTLT
ncbi:alpha/beta hydrolase [Neorhizobium sp. LjRoot104]|uniref:alpha/beta hydrolase n=1 Tax=Neorhizobium sp. LjRoot104 TaxID=3342254 RepID=UPI003F4F9AA8